MNQAIIFSAVQTIITAMLIWWLQRSLTKRDKKREKQDAARIKNELLLIQGVGVAIDLGEATAIAIKNGHTNGEIKTALQTAEDFRKKQTDFLSEKGLEAFLS